MNATAVLAPGTGAAEIAAPPRRAPAALTRRREILLVVAALLLGFALRAAIGFTDDAPTTDETAYLRSGAALVAGDGFVRGGHPELHFPPLLPFALGVADKVFGDPHTGAVVLTCVSSSLLVLPLSLLARRLAGPLAGVFTAWVAALAPGLSTTLVNRGAGSEAAYMLLLVTGVWLVVAALDRTGRAQVARVAGAGLAVGGAYLTRPEGLFVAVPLTVAVVAIGAGRPRPMFTGGRAALVRNVRAGLPLLAAFLVPLVLCIAPYAAYLHTHTGKWQLSAKTQDASLEAWHAVARGDREGRDSVLWALDETGMHISTERTSLAGLAKADPRGYASIVATNVGTLGTELSKPEVGQILTWLLLPLPVWAVAVVGAWRFRRSRLCWLLLAVTALPVATALAFFVQPRYLVVLVALGTVFVGAALGTTSLQWRKLVAGGVLALLAISTVQGFYGTSGGWWHPSDGTDQREAGEWIAAHAKPDERIMTRSMVVEYYARRPAMAIPYAELGDILAFGRNYGARYLVLDWYTAVRLRPQLEFLREVDAVPGLRLVHELRAEGHTTRIFMLEPAPPPNRPPGPSLGFVGDG